MEYNGFEGDVNMITNETLKVLEERRSCRKFKPDMVDEECLQAILKAGTYAPTGMGKQSPIIIAITNKETRDELSRLNAMIMGKEGFDPFYGAPVICVVLANKDARTYIYDGSLVAGNLMIAAQSVGVGSIWIHRAKEMFETSEGKAILEKLGIEGEYEGIGNIALGYIDGPIQLAAPRKENYIYWIR